MPRPDSAHYDCSDVEKRDLIKLIKQGKPLAVKVIDIFGNDTITLMPMTVG